MAMFTMFPGIGCTVASVSVSRRSCLGLRHPTPSLSMSQDSLLSIRSNRCEQVPHKRRDKRRGQHLGHVERTAEGPSIRCSGTHIL